jgi:predicted RNase H-like nuclease (RuvC/YqgF family)
MLKRAQEAAGEIAKILKELSERGQPEANDSKILELQAEISEKGEKISDLENRLKTALEMDMSANSQEVMTLKKDISRSLEIEYENYKASKGKEYSKDMYEAHYASLFRIFRTLKRLGIKFE